MASTMDAFRKARTVRKDLTIVRDHLVVARVALASAIATADDTNDINSDLERLLNALRDATATVEGEAVTWEIRKNFLRDTIIEARKEAQNAVDVAI